MKSNLRNMVTVLFAITLVASAGVGVVYRVTEAPIAEAKAGVDNKALQKVLPPFENIRIDTLVLDGLPVTIHTATNGDEVVGYAVKTVSPKGYSGDVRLMVGFTPEGEIINIDVLEQKETPGLGTKMAEEGNPLLGSFQGKNPAQMKMGVRKDGGEVDALTAATISSRAYVDAVARAYAAYAETVGIAVPVEAVSGASNTEATSGATNQTEQQTEAVSGATGQTEQETEAVSGATSRTEQKTEAVSGATSQTDKEDGKTGFKGRRKNRQDRGRRDRNE